MDMTRERISFIFDPRDMLSLHIVFSFVIAVVTCAILEKTSGLKPISETIVSRYSKLVTVPSFYSLILIFLWFSSALFVISLVFLSLISILYIVQVLPRLSARACGSCSFSARVSMSLANRRLVISTGFCLINYIVIK